MAGCGSSRAVASRAAARAGWACLGGLLCIWGCTAPATRFEIVNYRSNGAREVFHDDFDECLYREMPDGNMDIIARKVSRATSAEEQDVTQILHLRTVYRARPGTTYSEPSMINGTVHYAVITPQGGTCFEGAGFVSCKRKGGAGQIIGTVEEAEVGPNRRLGISGDVFEHVVLEGTFVARRDAARVVGLLNELHALFGPQPSYQLSGPSGESGGPR